MQVLLDPRVVTDAVLALLRDTDDEQAGPAPRRIGDHDGPADRAKPYGRLDTIPGGTIDAQGWGDGGGGTVVVQVSSVGETRDQAQLHQFWMRWLILGREAGRWKHPIEGDGWGTYLRELDAEGGVDPADDGVLFTAVDRYKLHITRR